MTVREVTIDKIRQLPESLVNEISDFVDFLIIKNDIEHWMLWKQLYESIETSESDFSDYLKNLEDYENKLASGEIKW